MDDLLDIAEVVRRTGVSSRTLRFYEARGLLQPLRTASGRRVYGPADLDRLAQILALKRAGLTLTQIQRLDRARLPDLGRLIEAQLDAISVRVAELGEARSLLLSVKSRIDRGEPIDVATFCSLISHGDTIMKDDGWKEVLERHYTPEELAHWAANPPLEGFDQAAYSRQWEALGARIEEALPLDPASDRAQAFLDEWNALLAPFRAVATPEMMAGASRFWAQAEQYRDDVRMPFSIEVRDLIAAAQCARNG
ncbi:MerR family transcriptional regulator [Allosphingosinicella deserti]|uniref:MerR family transcriptional regulator n=1 Tax=Allosphingosinicella deserti TaxID=2116704 RepID=A0A2P7QHV6_9SPHN|nr:MerR family transcriptional regulator [Sphingomonas deserti]PSJ37541.1 MerR family transcriptional regulator [Sphingomonas deserti]